ncbi:sodium:solute symporter family protein [Poriferisphaera sp. WC338]|uniref:sodium:solute symporter family protein n=1 Tax=Poriferisphaera sp. WC338 TaxID=3425129 RepID=UPI003D81261E
MHWIDWAICIVPLLVVGFIGLQVNKYVKGVSDFLVGGRVAGRYVVAVASGEAGLGLITVVALCEMYYKSGFAIGFWGMLNKPIIILIALTGFAVYRYRETRAMTMAQYFEVRYSKKFRIFAGILAWVSGVINYALFPAVGGRFLIYFCELPETVSILGLQFPTFGLVMACFLSVAVTIVLIGGQIMTMVTDCVAGIFSYVLYAAITITILAYFSWDQMQDAMLARPPGESMFDPFDTGKLKEFNVFYVIVGLMGSIYNMLSWQGGQGYKAAAASPHEQKMGNVLSTWRTGFSVLMVILLAAAAFTYMNHPDFATGAEAVQQELHQKINLATEASTNQIREQMLVPIALRHILPVGIVGAFCAVMVFLLISTDTTYLHSWGTIFVQDVVLPLRKKPFTPKQQMWLLRFSIAGVAFFAFFWSLYFNQVTYILMFFALTGSVYLGGAGAVILGGLYWKRGTSAGAWAAMISGSSLAVLGFILTQSWAGYIYPFLSSEMPGFLASLTTTLESLGSILPFVEWEVTPDKCPISGQEIYFITMCSAVFLYITVSLLTCKEPFNLDRMLHRGKYMREEDREARPECEHGVKKNWKNTLLGFDDQFTRGDKILSVSVFAYSMLLFAVWIFAVLCNTVLVKYFAFGPVGWANYFWYVNIGLTLVIGTVTSVWFSIGGAWDLRRLFRRLATLKRNVNDDGRVLGHINAEDLSFKEVEDDEDIEQLVAIDSDQSGSTR